MSLSNVKRGDIVALKEGAYVHYDEFHTGEPDESRPNTSDERFLVEGVEDDDLRVFPHRFAAENKGESYPIEVDWYGRVAGEDKAFVQKIKRDQILKILEPAREDEPCVGDYILDFEYWTNIEGYEGVIDNVIVENGEVSYDVHKMFPYDHAFGAGIGHSNEIIKRQAILAFDSSLRDSYERCDCDDRKRQEKGKPPSWLQPEDNRGLGVLVGCIGVFIVVVAAALLLGLVLR